MIGVRSLKIVEKLLSNINGLIAPESKVIMAMQQSGILNQYRNPEDDTQKEYILVIGWIRNTLDQNEFSDSQKGYIQKN